MRKINKNNYKKTMSKFATGVTIIYINDKKTFIGKTVNSFASLSLDPPLVLFALDKKASSLNKFKKSKFIGINFLSNKQKKLSDFFANKNNNSWKEVSYYLSKKNLPMIKNSIVNLSCQNIKTQICGDHILFICKILELKFDEKLKPLIYSNKKFM